MTISIKELQALCENLGLPDEDRGNGALVTLLPFEDAKEREAYGALLIEMLSEGREIRLASVPLFTLTDISSQPEALVQLMAGLFSQVGSNRIGCVGMGNKQEIYYFHTAILEDSTLTLRQFESLLAGMMEGIRSTFALARKFSQEPAEEANEKLPPEQKLHQMLLQAEEALAVIERNLGTEEQQAVAWEFIADLLKPGRLPEKVQSELARLSRPAFVIENTERPIW